MQEHSINPFSAVSRRQFLKRSSLIAASAAAAASFPSVLNAQDKQAINAVIIGVGGRGSGAGRDFTEASKAAGRTGLVCAGGSTVGATTFLTQLHEQIHVGGATGNATGRNIHQRSLDEAVRLTKAISAITLGDYDVDRALAVFNGTEDFSI